jgi:hypothetical protein
MNDTFLSGVVAAMIAVMVFGFIGFFSAAVAVDSIREGCAKHGQFTSGNKIYTCKGDTL